MSTNRPPRSPATTAATVSSVGARVRVTDDWLAYLRARGCRTERFEGHGTVLEVETNERYGWTSVLVDFDGRERGHIDPSDLLAVPS